MPFINNSYHDGETLGPYGQVRDHGTGRSYWAIYHDTLGRRVLRSIKVEGHFPPSPPPRPLTRAERVQARKIVEELGLNG